MLNKLFHNLISFIIHLFFSPIKTVMVYFCATLPLKLDLFVKNKFPANKHFTLMAL